MPSAIQLDPALLAAGAWLWTGTAWVRCSGDSAGRVRVNLAGSEITLNTYTYPTAGTHNVAVQNFPGNQQVTPYPNSWLNVSLTASALVKGSSGYVHWFQGANNNASAQLMVLKNGISGAASDYIVMILPPYDSKSFSFFPACSFSAGIYFYTPVANTRGVVGYY